MVALSCPEMGHPALAAASKAAASAAEIFGSDLEMNLRYDPSGIQLVHGDSFVVTLAVNVQLGDKTTISNTASVNSSTIDPVTANNSASLTTKVSAKKERD
jgi:hypothetical protein